MQEKDVKTAIINYVNKNFNKINFHNVKPNVIENISDVSITFQESYYGAGAYQVVLSFNISKKEANGDVSTLPAKGTTSVSIKENEDKSPIVFIDDIFITSNF